MCALSVYLQVFNKYKLCLRAVGNNKPSLTELALTSLFLTSSNFIANHSCFPSCGVLNGSDLSLLNLSKYMKHCTWSWMLVRAHLIKRSQTHMLFISLWNHITAVICPVEGQTHLTLTHSASVICGLISLNRAWRGKCSATSDSTIQTESVYAVMPLLELNRTCLMFIVQLCGVGF